MCRGRGKPAGRESPFPAGKQSPLATASWLSQLTFSWVAPLIATRGALREADMWDAMPADQTAPLHACLQQAWDLQLQQPKPSLGKAFIHAFGAQYLLFFLPAMFKAASLLAQTQFLGLLLTELRLDTPEIRAAYLYGLGVVLCGVGGCLGHHTYFFHAWRAGLHWRTAGLALIFHKSLKLRVDSVSAGHVINLASGDLERFQKLSQYCVYPVLAPIETAIICWLLWREVGIATLAGLAMLAILVACQSAFSAAFGRLRHATAVISDERVRAVAQVVSGIRVLKMQGWEAPFARQVAETRAREIGRIRTAAIVRGVNEGLYLVAPTLVAASIFLVYHALGNTLTARALFVTMSLFSLLQVEATKFFPAALEGWAEVTISLRRIQAFLLLPEVAPPAALEDAGAAASQSVSESPAAIFINDVSCVWKSSQHQGNPATAKRKPPLPVTPSPSPSAAVIGVCDSSIVASPAVEPETPLTLRHVTLSVPQGSLTMLVGPVSCGKTSLLMALLRELPVNGGVASTGLGAGVTPSSAVPSQQRAAGIRVSGRVAYVSQVPWIISGSVRDNITFGLPFDAQRYARVVDACCLHRDIAGFPAGDAEVIGERGVNCSGGQRARLGLARACYLDADVYLIDDCLAAVDAKVGRRLFRRCIAGLLAGKTRLLVLHQLQYLRAADAVAVMARGRIVAQGSFDALARALRSSQQQQQQQQKGGGEPAAAANAAAAGGMDELGEALGEILSHGGPPALDDGGEAIRSSGSFSVAGAGADPRRRGSTSAGSIDLSSIAPDMLSVEDGDDEDEEGVEGGGGVEGCESLTSQSVTATDKSLGGADTPAVGASSPVTAPSSLVQAEGLTGAAAGGAPAPTVLAAFASWGAACGGPLVVTYLALLLGGGATLVTYTFVWLAAWGNSPAADQANPRYPAVYGGLTAATLAASIWRSVASFSACVTASRAMHDAAFAHVLKAPLSFFDANPAGRILNRFSKDVGLIDDLLPLTAFDFAASLAASLAIVALISAANPWLLVAVAPLFAALYALLRYYMPTAGTVKRLEAVTRSPIYSLMNEVLAGLPVIRAFRLAPQLQARFAAASDANARAYFLFLGASRWLGVRLDLLCVLLLAATVFACVAASGAVSATLIGLCISQTATLAGSAQWTARQFLELQVLFTSVERVQEYARLPTEAVDVDEEEGKGEGAEGAEGGGAAAEGAGDGAEADLPPPAALQVSVAVGDSIGGGGGGGSSSRLDAAAWPSRGALAFRDVWMRYRPGMPPVLRGLTLSIPAGAKVGLVGRTGAGKSSTLLALLRLVEPERHPLLGPDVQVSGGVAGGCGGEGGASSVSSAVPAGGCGVSIDGIDIASVPLTRLRRALSVIPQDPVLYSGTVRFNCDPFGRHSDAAIVTALRRVQLWDAQLAPAGGLALQLVEGGANLSVGARQLLCLARALLRRARVILIDEASANVDEDTDAAIQATIRSAFAHATIVTVAHRLGTVIDADAIVVLEAGRAAEAGHPHELLEAGRGHFWELVQQTGPAAAARLAAEASRAWAGRAGLRRP